MTDKTTAALKLAEEALENYGIEGTKSVAGIKCTEALAALREALAEQDKQEPVAWRCRYCNTDMPTEHASDCPIEICGLPNAYAAPVSAPKQEPVQAVTDILDKCISLVGTEMVRGTQAGDKWFMCQRFVHAMRDMQYEFKRDYAAPVSAKREWVDLTDDEVVALEREVGCFAIGQLGAAIAKFKSKNTPPVVQQGEPVFMYRPIGNGELFEGPVHIASDFGKMLLIEKPDDWLPLYATPPNVPQGEPVAWI